MPAKVVWNVQPYKKLSDLKDNYTSFLVLSLRQEAPAIAEEATQWMRNHARWNDRTAEEKAKERDKWARTHHARAGLMAEVVTDSKQDDAREFERAKAASQDRSALVALNQSRRDAALNAQDAYRKETAERKRLKAAGKPVPAQRTTVWQAGYSQAKVLPEGMSMLSRLNETYRQEDSRYPIMQIHFHHDEKLYYAVWLELAKGGRYSVLAPALEYWKPKTMGKLRQRLNLIQYRHITLGDIQSAEAQFQQTMVAHQEDTGFAYRPYGSEARMNKRRQNQKAYKQRGRTVDVYDIRSDTTKTYDYTGSPRTRKRKRRK